MSNVQTLHQARVGDPSTILDEDSELARALAAAGGLASSVDDGTNAWATTPLAKQWARFRDQFAEAMEGGLYTVEDLEVMIVTGEAYFWPGVNSAVVAKRVVYPSGEAVMQTLWAVGDIEEVVALEPGIAATGRLLGCSSMLVEGRAAWTKVLKSAGYEPWSVTLRKAL